MISRNAGLGDTQARLSLLVPVCASAPAKGGQVPTVSDRKPANAEEYTVPEPNLVPRWQWGENWIPAVTPEGTVTHDAAVAHFQKLAKQPGCEAVNPDEVVLVKE
jgi:hypothetical protein